MAQSLQQFSAIWKRLGVNQKISLGFMMLLVIGGIGVLVNLSRRQVFDVLYTDLEDRDTAKVVSYLEDNKIPYRLDHGGKSILVPRDRKYNLRLSVADKNLISNGTPGVDSLEAPGWGASRTAEQMWKRRAIQSELARTIMHIQQVEWAGVQVAQPEPSLFVEDEKPVTAAITIKARSGATLSGAQISGICRLVASSVEGLKDENVTVIDERGNLLSSRRQANSAIQGAADAHEQQQVYEQYLIEKCQTMLDQVLGPGKAVVKVNAILDLQQMTETKTEYSADGAVVRSEKITSSNGSEAAGGSKSTETAETNYEVPQVVRTVQNSPGQVVNLAVAVLLDPTYVGADGKEATRTQEEIDQLAETVKRAVGLVEAAPRSDTFQLTSVRFHGAPAIAATEPEGAFDGNKRAFVLQLARYGSSVVAVGIFLLFARAMLKKSSVAVMTSTPQRVQSFAAGVPVSLPQEEMELEALRNNVRMMLTESPDKAARILQSWIKEG